MYKPLPAGWAIGAHFVLGFMACLAFLNLKSIIWDAYVPNDFEAFPEPAWRPPGLISATTVASTPFARFEVHKVRTENGVIVNDWLWTDERSHVNILVHLKGINRYLLFKQMKYGLTSPKLATIGGLFEEGESPEDCAHRELLEETGLVAGEMVNLGAYRVQVNRGGGILHAFLARDSVKSNMHKSSDDYESQSKVYLDQKELTEVILKGEVGEAQWVATAALGTMYMEHHHAPKKRLIDEIS